MKHPELYQRTVDILVDAYFNDTLEHGNCYACAVGNMIAGNCNYDIADTGKPWKVWLSNQFQVSNPKREGWASVFMTDYNIGKQVKKYYNYNHEAKRQIDSTGYSLDQLAKVEYAFEMADKGASQEDYMFNGLMAVIDVLDIIHENTDAAAIQSTKKRFVKNLTPTP